MSIKKNKKKKEKITYIDDGSTIADMSSTSKTSAIFGGVDRKSASDSLGRRRASLREQWNTYWAAVKMMFLPMLVVMGIISIAFLVMYFLYRP